MSESDEYLSSAGSEDESSMPESTEHDETCDELEVFGLVEPYEGEPRASSVDDSNESEENGEVDQDGLSPATLRSRFEQEVLVNEWCQCGECASENLVSALEYRCCREVSQASQKLTFDGSIERISCITRHDDFAPMSHRAVLLQVAPLLKDQNGRGYRRRSGQTENDFLRAVAYRWVVRWIYGYIGWESRRPPLACVYKCICLNYPSAQAAGYQPSL